jgi:hypothetical protein
MPIPRLTALAALTAVAAVAAGSAAAAAGSAFEVGQVVAEVKRQLAQVNAEAVGGLRIDDAQLDLVLVESLTGKGAALVVPAADYQPGSKEGTPRPLLKRRLVLDIQPGRDSQPARPAATPAGGGATGRLAVAVGELRGGVQQAMASDPGFDLRRLTLDLDFALERDPKGALQLILFTLDQRIEPASVHGLKLRLAADAPGRSREPRAKDTPPPPPER